MDSDQPAHYVPPPFKIPRSVPVTTIQKREFFGYIAIFCPFDIVICIHKEYMTFKPNNCSQQEQQRLTQHMHEVPMATGVNAN